MAHTNQQAKSKVKRTGYRVSISAGPDGTIEAVYVHVRRKKVASTHELIAGKLLADYAASGELVGLEIIGPVKLSALSRKLPAEDRKPLHALLSQTSHAFIHA